MKRNIITTADGSKTIQIEEWNEHYHSVHGAINEANHVYIKHGLLFYFTQVLLKSTVGISEVFQPPSSTKNTISPKSAVEAIKPEIAILEIGFGTGLNAFLTLIEAEKLKLGINYVGVEAYPIQPFELQYLNYTELISKIHKPQFDKLHDVGWEVSQNITNQFILKKEKKFFQDIRSENQFDIIYFDAFGSRVQPELWTESIFEIMYKALKINGILVTYSVKGTVKRALRDVGFTVTRLPGPPGKHHMLRAIKS